MTPHITVVTSVTAALNLMGMGSAQWLLLGYTGLSWAADACETMILSYLGPSAACFWPETVGPAQESILTSIVFAGMLVGVYSLGAAADALGRRKGFLLSALLLGGAGLASAAAPSFWTLLALRAVVGFALGGTPIAVTLFAEWVPPARRGFLLLLQQSAWTVGTMLEACLAWAVLPTLGWRWLLGLSAVPMLLLLAAYPLLPESPYWLCAKGRHQEAEGEVLKMADCGAAQGERTWTVRFSTENDHLTESSSDSATPEGLPEDEGSSRRRSSCTAGSTSAGGGSLKQRLVASAQGALGHLFSPELRVTTSLLWGIWFVNAITYYGLVLLTTSLQTDQPGRQKCTDDGRANFTAQDYTAVLITSAAEAPGLAIAALLVDVKGRIWCIRSGMLLCAGSILGLLVASTHAVQLVLLFCARACVEGTFCVLYVFTPEQYPTHVRSFGLALCNSFSRFGGLAAPFVTVYLVEQGRSGAAETLLGTLCLLAAVAATLLPHETKGRDLNAVALAPDGAVGDINGTRNGGIESSLAERQPLNEMHSHRI